MHEPSRRAERTAGALLVAFALLTFLVRDHWGPVLRVDRSLGGTASRWTDAHPVLGDIALGIGVLASFPVRALVVAGLVALLLVHGHRRGAWFVGGVALSGALLNLVVKSLVDRPRPTSPLASPDGYSFPSGHAMGAAICVSLVVSVLLFSGTVEAGTRWWLLVGVVVVLVVGVSRVVLGVHYASDVVGGWALGVGWVALATALFRPWRT